MQVHSSLQVEATIGVTETKRKFRKDLNSLAHYSAALLTAYSNATCNFQLKADHSKSHSTFVNMRDNQFQFYVERLLNDIELHFNDLTAYGISEDSKNELNASYQNWRSVLAKPRAAINARKGEGFMLRELVKTADALLYNGLDKLMVPFKGSIPIFHFQYRSARKLLESHRHKNRDGE